MKNVHYIIFCFAVLFFVSCEDQDPSTSDLKYWLIDIDDGGKFTTSDGDGQIISTARFLIRGNKSGDNPSGDWNLSIKMHCHMDMEENTAGEAEGYYSGMISYNTVNVTFDKLQLGVLDPATHIGYFYGVNDFTLPYFNTTPGSYHLVVYDDDGNPHTLNGTQYFLTGWPETMSLHVGGSDSENCSTVRCVTFMVDEGGLMTTDLTLHGNLYQFASQQEMDNWSKQHPQIDYLTEPGLIPFH